MLIGAFGPWIKALGQSVSGTDGSNDGWLIVVAAGVGAALFYVRRSSRTAGVWPVLAGIGGVIVTLYDRSNIQDKIHQGGALLQAVAQVGWGLNLALAASASMAIAGVVVWAQSAKDEPASTSTPSPPPEPSTPPAASPVPPPE